MLFGMAANLGKLKIELREAEDNLVKALAGKYQSLTIYHFYAVVYFFSFYVHCNFSLISGSNFEENRVSRLRKVLGLLKEH